VFVIVRGCSDGNLHCRGDAVVVVCLFVSLFAGFCGYEAWGYRFSICKRFCGSLFLIIVCLFVFVFGIFCRGAYSSCCSSPSILSDL
jgi:hypothetical protein